MILCAEGNFSIYVSYFSLATYLNHFWVWNMEISSNY